MSLFSLGLSLVLCFQVTPEPTLAIPTSESEPTLAAPEKSVLQNATPINAEAIPEPAPKIQLSEKSVLTPKIQLSMDESKVVTEVNRYRATYKLRPLVVDPILMRVARERVPYFTHRYRGLWMWDECRRAGFRGFATDNLGQGDLTAASAVEGWANSPVGHAEQMRGLFKMNGKWEDRKYTKVGAARSGRNWILVLGRPDSNQEQ